MEETKGEQINSPFKKDLILREELAIQRTFLANQSTFLSFLRSSMYFLVAGLSVNKLVDGNEAVIFEYILFSSYDISILELSFECSTQFFKIFVIASTCHFKSQFIFITSNFSLI